MQQVKRAALAPAEPSAADRAVAAAAAQQEAQARVELDQQDGSGQSSDAAGERDGPAAEARDDERPAVASDADPAGVSVTRPGPAGGFIDLIA